MREQLAFENLVPGAVIRIPVNDTNPPKIKYLIIVGIDGEEISFATVFLNSDLNLNVINTAELQHLQIWIERSKCDGIIESDCYADCSKITERNKDHIKILIQKDPSMHRGKLPDEYFISIRKLLSEAKTILPFFKKKYNF